jgi:GT2 family glycosyltransferase
MPDLSVIIVTRNTCTLTCAAIESVLQSRDSLSKEIVLVDNGSSDGTAKVVAERFPSVRCLRSDANLGFARANNLAARETHGRFLLLLNSDARVQPETLGLAVAWMEAHSHCGVTGGQLLNPDGTRQNSIANYPSLATELLNKSLLRRLFPQRFPGKEQVFAEPVEVESVIGAFMLARREAWTAVCGLDERYFFFLEETDFCLAVRQNGWQVMHLPQVKVWHDQGSSASQVSTAARIEYWRSRYRYFGKHHSAGAGALLKVGLLLRLLAGWLANGLVTALTLGRIAGPRERFRVYAVLWRWHLRGCPDDTGLPR